MLPRMGDLQAKFIAASPRHGRIATPAASLAIHGCILAVWLVLLVRAWFPGVLGWGRGDGIRRL